MTALPSVAELAGLAAKLGRRVQLMEVCGTHTMAAFRSGLRSLLPQDVGLLSGPGCPVCVTPNRFIDRALRLAEQPGTVVTTFGDMMRVPGSRASLEKAHARGAAVKVVYSPLDALEEARRHPELRVVFLGVGFETTAPTSAWVIQEARRSVPNFSVLCAHKTMPEAMAALLRAGEVRIDGFLCPGHVSVVIGAAAYRGLASEFGVPCIITGFEGGDIVRGIEMALRQLVEGRAEVEIQYTRSVTWEGNARAREALADVFEEDDAEWRGLGMIRRSGLRIRREYAGQDADRVFSSVPEEAAVEAAGCRCGDVLRGAIKPPQCPLFGKVCTPANPVGACMVSSEGTCAAYYKYQ